MKISLFIKKITVSLLFVAASSIWFFEPVVAVDDSISDSLLFVPETTAFTGIDAGDNTSTSVSATTAHIPVNAAIVSATFSFIQDNTSTGFVKIVDKNTAETIDTISFSESGLRITTAITQYLQSWISSPETNRGVLMQAYELSAADELNIIDIKIAVSYILPDDLEPNILEMTIDSTNQAEMQLSWISDEPTRGYVTYGKTVIYTLQTDYSIDYELENTIILTELTPGMTYHFSLVIEDMSGNETVSKDDTFRTDFDFTDAEGDALIITSDGINPPTSFTAEYANDAVRLQWNASQDNDLLGYVVYKKINTSTYKEIATLGINDTNFIDTDIGIDNRYTYIIRAFSNAAISTASEEQMVYITNSSDVLGTDTSTSDEFNKDVQKGLIIFGFLSSWIFIIYLIYKKLSNKMLATKPGLENVLKNPDYFRNDEY